MVRRNPGIPHFIPPRCAAGRPGGKPKARIMPRLRIKHRTTYTYSQPMSFGEHRLMVRPRDSHDLRLVSAELRILPVPTLRWIHDPFGNSVTIAEFSEMSTELSFESEIVIERFPDDTTSLEIEPYAQSLPFNYLDTELPDLAPAIARRDSDPYGIVDLWALGFMAPGGPTDTLSLLIRMTESIRHDFTYIAREAVGVQTAAETLNLRSGTCRDYALLMMEAVRSLGIAAHFVTGYLYDPALDAGNSGNSDGGAAILGAGATHAWCEVYLPGLGWVSFDPTNGRYGSEDLIRIGIARAPEQAQPLSGLLNGDPSTALGMDVQVSVTREDG